MNILFLLTQDMVSPAGMGRYFPLAKELVKRGHRVKIVGLHSDFHSLKQRDFVQEGVEISYVSQMHVKKIGNKKHYFSIYKLMWLVIYATIKLGWVAFGFPVDILFIGKPHPMNGIAGLFLKWIRQVPVVVDCDDFEGANNRFQTKWQKKIMLYSETFILKTADHITTHSHVLERYFISIGISKEKITYLPHGVDEERFSNLGDDNINELRIRLGIEKIVPVIVFVGSISLLTHAIDLLMQAFVLIKRSLPTAKLLLVGGGEDYDYLITFAHELGISGEVCFCGKIDPAHIPFYYRLGNVSIDPVCNNLAGQASVSLKMFESWAAGVPLVTVDVGDRNHLLGKPPAGVLVPPDNPIILAEAIVDLLDDSERLLTLKETGLRHVEKFYWKRLAEEVEQTFLNIICV